MPKLTKEEIEAKRKEILEAVATRYLPEAVREVIFSTEDSVEYEQDNLLDNANVLSQTKEAILIEGIGTQSLHKVHIQPLLDKAKKTGLGSVLTPILGALKTNFKLTDEDLKDKRASDVIKEQVEKLRKESAKSKGTNSEEAEKLEARILELTGKITELETVTIPGVRLEEQINLHKYKSDNILSTLILKAGFSEDSLPAALEHIPLSVNSKFDVVYVPADGDNKESVSFKKKGQEFSPEINGKPVSDALPHIIEIGKSMNFIKKSDGSNDGKDKYNGGGNGGDADPTPTVYAGNVQERMKAKIAARKAERT